MSLSGALIKSVEIESKNIIENIEEESFNMQDLINEMNQEEEVEEGMKVKDGQEDEEGQKMTVQEIMDELKEKIEVGEGLKLDIIKPEERTLWVKFFKTHKELASILGTDGVGLFALYGSGVSIIAGTVLIMTLFGLRSNEKTKHLLPEINKPNYEIKKHS